MLQQSHALFDACVLLSPIRMDEVCQADAGADQQPQCGGAADSATAGQGGGQPQAVQTGRGERYILAGGLAVLVALTASKLKNRQNPCFYLKRFSLLSMIP